MGNLGSELRLLTASDGERRRHGPTPAAVRSFDVRSAKLRPFAGGQGQTWTDGRLVLKPVGYVPEHDWVCDVYATWSTRDVRVPEPVRPSGAEDAWSLEGWAAHVLVPGRDAEPVTEIDQVLAASDAFHSAVAALPRPAFLDDRRDPWAFGDRLAWDEDGVALEGDAPTLLVIERLRAHLAPVASPDQVIHGDVCRTCSCTTATPRP